MKKQDLKNYNRLLKMENEALEHLLQEVENRLGGDSQCGLSKLLNDRNDELIDDINDIQADWAVERIVLAKALKEYDSDLALSNKKNENLQEDLETAGKRITGLEADNARLRSVTSDLEILNRDMSVELEKINKEKEKLQAEFYRLKPTVTAWDKDSVK